MDMDCKTYTSLIIKKELNDYFGEIYLFLYLLFLINIFFKFLELKNKQIVLIYTKDIFTESELDTSEDYYNEDSDKDENSNEDEDSSEEEEDSDEDDTDEDDTNEDDTDEDDNNEDDTDDNNEDDTDDNNEDDEKNEDLYSMKHLQCPLCGVKYNEDDTDDNNEDDEKNEDLYSMKHLQCPLCGVKYNEDHKQYIFKTKLLKQIQNSNSEDLKKAVSNHNKKSDICEEYSFISKIFK